MERKLLEKFVVVFNNSVGLLVDVNCYIMATSSGKKHMFYNWYGSLGDSFCLVLVENHLP